MSTWISLLCFIFCLMICPRLTQTATTSPQADGKPESGSTPTATADGKPESGSTQTATTSPQADGKPESGSTQTATADVKPDLAKLKAELNNIMDLIGNSEFTSESKDFDSKFSAIPMSDQELQNPDLNSCLDRLSRLAVYFKHVYKPADSSQTEAAFVLPTLNAAKQIADVTSDKSLQPHIDSIKIEDFQTEAGEIISQIMQCLAKSFQVQKTYDMFSWVCVLDVYFKTVMKMIEENLNIEFIKLDQQLSESSRNSLTFLEISMLIFNQYGSLSDANSNSIIKLLDNTIEKLKLLKKIASEVQIQSILVVKLNLQSHSNSVKTLREHISSLKNFPVPSRLSPEEFLQYFNTLLNSMLQS